MDFKKLNECLYEMYHRDLTYSEKMKQIQMLVAPCSDIIKDLSDIKTQLNDWKNDNHYRLNEIKTLIYAWKDACENENT